MTWLFAGILHREGLKLPVEFMVEGILSLDCLLKQVLLPGSLYFFGNNVIVIQFDVALRLFSEGTQPELFNFFNRQAADTDDVEIEDSVFSYGVMPHFEDDISV